MDHKDVLQRSLDVGRDAGQRTQEQLEAVVGELVRRSEEQADMARRLLSDLVERSRSTSEQVTATVDRELRNQIANLGLATRADIERLEAKIEALDKTSRSTKRAAGSKRSASAKKSSGAKRSASAKKSSAAKKATKRSASDASGGSPSSSDG